MARTITIDTAQVRAVRLFLDPLGKTGVQASLTMLAGTQMIERIDLKDYTARLQLAELAAAQALLATITAAVQRAEL